MFQINDEKRRIAQKQARPFGLRGKSRHAALRDLIRERPLPASRALPGEIWRSNAARDETSTDPSSGMTFRFKRPVYADEALSCRWTITEIDERGRARAQVTITNPDDVVVLEAETTGVIPGDAERARLAAMVAEGDSTNGVIDR